jgi:hypothetical protein
MSSDILSNAFTTTRPLELEYRKVSLFREHGLVFEMSTRIGETKIPSIATEPVVLTDALCRQENPR